MIPSPPPQPRSPLKDEADPIGPAEPTQFPGLTIMRRLILLTFFFMEISILSQCTGVLVEDGQLIARGGPYTGAVTLGDVD